MIPLVARLRLGTTSRPGTTSRLAVLLLAVVAFPRIAAGEEPRANYFNDPFEAVTQGIADCPVPQGPLLTRSEMQAQAHERAERGTRCYAEGYCRLPNAYDYDRDIVARVRKAIGYDGRFAQSSVWVLGQRRMVWLKGCVRAQADKAALERIARRVDDVENVVNELVVRPR